mmetsp:Transcript_4175/g.11782  ORF Transcript_4175/g.11782 Transcript_4175/m.11782 type:complete len:244 (+) Transcript_4175:218-949(+)
MPGSPDLAGLVVAANLTVNAREAGHAFTAGCLAPAPGPFSLFPTLRHLGVHALTVPLSRRRVGCGRGGAAAVAVCGLTGNRGRFAVSELRARDRIRTGLAGPAARTFTDWLAVVQAAPSVCSAGRASQDGRGIDGEVQVHLEVGSRLLALCDEELQQGCANHHHSTIVALLDGEGRRLSGAHHICDGLVDVGRYVFKGFCNNHLHKSVPNFRDKFRWRPCGGIARGECHGHLTRGGLEGKSRV